MLADYHIHTKMCGHAQGELEEYVLQARAVGLDEIGISDHIPMYFWPEEERDPTIAMTEAEIPAYIALVQKMQEKFHPFPIKLGIEADFDAGYQSELRTILGQYPFDFVLGSIHFLDKWGYDNPQYIEEYEYRDIDDIYAQYFGLLEEAALSGDFDILAHPDLVKKLGFRPKKELTYIYERLAKVIAEVGICIEINTSGLRAPVGEIFPAVDFLREFCKRGVPVTMGSDAHKPEFVGKDFALAKKLLQEIGYKEIAVFNQRKRSMISL